MKTSLKQSPQQRKTLFLKQMSSLGMILITIVGLMQLFFSPQSKSDSQQNIDPKADSTYTRVEVLP